MNRKRFLLLCGVIAAGIATPGLTRWYRRAHLRPWWYPESLAPLFDEATMREIGAAYRTATQSGSTLPDLRSLLLTSPDGSLVSADDPGAARRMLERKVQSDFGAGRIVMVAGWVLSVTEARQCAFLSLGAGEPHSRS